MRKRYVFAVFFIIFALPLVSAASLNLNFSTTQQYITLTDFSKPNQVYTATYDPTCSGCLAFAPLDDLVNATTTIYLSGTQSSATVKVNGTAPSLVPGVVGEAFKFDGKVNEGVDIAVNVPDTFAVAFWVNLTSYPTTTADLVSSSSFSLAVNSTGGLIFSVNLNVSGNSTTFTLSGLRVLTGKYFYVVAAYNSSSGEMVLQVWNTTTSQSVVKSVGGAYKLYSAPTSVVIGSSTTYSATVTGVLDEFRLMGGLPSSMATELVVHIGRYALGKLANLTVVGVVKTPSAYDIQINVSLPTATLLPVPSPTLTGLSVVKEFNGLKFVNVSGRTAVNITLPVSLDLATPLGVQDLVFINSGKLYVLTHYPINLTIAGLTSIYLDGLNKIASGSNTFELKNLNAGGIYPECTGFWASPQVAVNITPTAYGKVLINFTASAPTNTSVNFTFSGLYPSYNYHFLVDGKEVNILKTGSAGNLQFAWSNWSTHTFTLKAFTAGETYFSNSLQVGTNIFKALTVAPLIGLALVVGYLMHMYQTGGEVNLDVETVIRSYGGLLFILGIIAFVVLVVVAALAQSGIL